MGGLALGGMDERETSNRQVEEVGPESVEGEWGMTPRGLICKIRHHHSQFQSVFIQTYGSK